MSSRQQQPLAAAGEVERQQLAVGGRGVAVFERKQLRGAFEFMRHLILSFLLHFRFYRCCFFHLRLQRTAQQHGDTLLLVDQYGLLGRQVAQRHVEARQVEVVVHSEHIGGHLAEQVDDHHERGVVASEVQARLASLAMRSRPIEQEPLQARQLRGLQLHVQRLVPARCCLQSLLLILRSS